MRCSSHGAMLTISVFLSVTLWFSLLVAIRPTVVSWSLNCGVSSFRVMISFLVSLSFNCGRDSVWKRWKLIICFELQWNHSDYTWKLFISDHSLRMYYSFAQRIKKNLNYDKKLRGGHSVSTIISLCNYMTDTWRH